jgi:hypothetical protein
MKLVIDIPEAFYEHCKANEDAIEIQLAVKNGTPLNNATNGDVIKTMFGDDKVSEFMGYARIMARVGNWFNDGVVAEFNKDWWNAPYQK